jgi:SAM-dependent methyltransferase
MESLNWAEIAADLPAHDAVRQATLQQVCIWLAPLAGSTVLDAGCGAGGMTTLLARAVGPRGRVVAVDAEPAMLAHLQRQQAALDDAAPVELVLGDVLAEETLEQVHRLLPDGADLLWASGMVHHLPDEVAGLHRLAEMVSPGGRLALCEGGLPTRSLPWDTGLGEPGLEARLEVAQSRWFQATVRDASLGAVARSGGWPDALTAAGFLDVSQRSFLLDRPAPLSPAERSDVVHHLTQARERLGSWLDDRDVDTLQRLLDPAEPQGVHQRTDLGLLGVQTVQVGRRGQGVSQR